MNWKLKLALISSLLVAGFFWQVDTAAASADCYVYSEDVGMVCSTIEQPTTFTEPVEVKNSFLSRTEYVRLADLANVYDQPNGQIVRNVGDGFLYSTISGRRMVDGQLWYMINLGEWVKGTDARLTESSQFRGVEVLRQPVRPFGWVVVRDFVPSSEPGGPEDLQFNEMYRYDFFEIYDAVVDDEGWMWYDLGDGRWVKQTNVSIVDVKARPEGVGENEYWTEIDLYEQTLAAYEGDRMVFATLISSGDPRWPTYEGLFQVWSRFEQTKMSGAEGRVDYYFVEDVPHTMYFDEKNEIALHGAYWHDRFGYKHSHGCVNMPPMDAEWVFNWSAEAGHDLWVWAHTSDPLDYFPRHDREVAFVGP